ncbi:MAG: hypothetical protein ACI8W3_003570, partial [Myxococcota bacterium]
ARVGGRASMGTSDIWVFPLFSDLDVAASIGPVGSNERSGPMIK